MGTNGPLVVNNFWLPKPYSDFIRSYKSSDEFWERVDRKRWLSMFPEQEIDYPLLYPYNLLMLVNETWAGETREIFLGRADGICVPGSLSPERSVLIGELATDGLIALDFFTSVNRPSVCYLKWCAPHTLRWELAAPDVETLLFELGAL